MGISLRSLRWKHKIEEMLLPVMFWFCGYLYGASALYKMRYGSE